MKIKIKEKSYEEVLAMPAGLHERPVRPLFLFRLMLKALSYSDLRATNFTHKEIGMERLGKGEPCLILMNHSSFIDLKIAATILYPRPFNIVCTSDGFVGKNRLIKEGRGAEQNSGGAVFFRQFPLAAGEPCPHRGGLSGGLPEPCAVQMPPLQSGRAHGGEGHEADLRQLREGVRADGVRLSGGG